MHFDLYTLGVIGLAVGVAISLSSTLLGMVLRGMPALRIWAVAFWVLVVGAVAQGMPALGPMLSMVAGNGLIALANALMLMGIAVHVCYPLRWRWPLTAVGVYVAFQAGFALVPAPRVEAIVFGAHSMLWDAWMIWVLLWRSPRDLRNSCRFTALVFAIDAGFYLLRSLAVLHPAVGAYPMLGNALSMANFLFGTLCTFLLSTGFTLMLAQRLTLDLRRLARTDGLTGLLNRAAVQEEGERTIEQFRNLHRPCALLMFDLDNFKSINDSWGMRWVMRCYGISSASLRAACCRRAHCSPATVARNSCCYCRASMRRRPPPWPSDCACRWRGIRRSMTVRTSP